MTAPALPTNPVAYFTDGDYDLTNLNVLGYAVNFMTNNDVKPCWHVYHADTTAFSASTWTNMKYTSSAFDNSGVWTSGTAPLTIQTVGIYSVEHCTQIKPGTTGIGFLTRFQITNGPNNPYFTSGSTKNFGVRGGLACQSGADAAICGASITPRVMYPGDTIAVQAYVTTTGIQPDNNNNASYNQGRFACQFTGMWISDGTGTTSPPPPPPPTVYKVNNFTIHWYEDNDVTSADPGKYYITIPQTKKLHVYLPPSGSQGPGNAIIVKHNGTAFDTVVVPQSGEHINGLPNSNYTDGLHLSLTGQARWFYPDTDGSGWWSY